MKRIRGRKRGEESGDRVLAGSAQANEGATINDRSRFSWSIEPVLMNLLTSSRMVRK